ncbi:DUF6693 family protein [Limobrevibacterium gyesilva]|uniref:Uncharacterized protein n=1 Tax=Limobrevibacterium gyesilva TaxID=2991712 RepID=A0AA41YK50_9PROT|nr:DUF6693 family protein [Limobrevibacterium gyesilva]MCW3473323.1 hypothetical protein [Limobrevibacterium gyesilva]
MRLSLAETMPAGTRLRNELRLGKVWPPFLVWLIVTAATSPSFSVACLPLRPPQDAANFGGRTLGLGWLVVSGHFFKLIINNTTIVDSNGRLVGRLQCDYDVETDAGHIVVWVVLSIVTLGVGLLFYSFRAARSALDATVIEWY